jgi:hypothetical protein
MIASGWGYDIWSLLLGFGAGLACGFLNTAASAGSAVSLPILMMIGLDPVSANATNRIPVLIGALSATARFHQRKALPWEVALKVSLPVLMGGLIGAGLAEVLPGRDLALIITAAVLVALGAAGTAIPSLRAVKHPILGLETDQNFEPCQSCTCSLLYCVAIHCSSQRTCCCHSDRNDFANAYAYRLQ